MKRIIIVCIALAANIVAGNAQYFVEGSVSVGVDRRDSESDGGMLWENSDFLINVSPQVGYWLNDNVAVGVRVTLSQHNSKSTATDPINVEEESNTFRWQVAAFGRYKLWSTGRFSLQFDSSIYYGKGNTKNTSKTETSFIENSASTSRIGALVSPFVTYDLNEKFNIKAWCNFLSMELYSENTKYENRSNIKDRTNHLGFNTQSSIFNLSNLNIGFIYHF